MPQSSFVFEIGQTVALAMSGESGRVCGRAEYDHGENTYWVRYKAGDGCQRENWWQESAIKAS